MKLTLIPAGWASSGSGINRQSEQNVFRYEVQGLPGDDRVTINATESAQEGKTWTIHRNDKSTDKQYASAESAREALEGGEE